MEIVGSLSLSASSIVGIPVVLEGRTTDYEANAANLGKMWMRQDSNIALVKVVILSNVSTYAVKTLTVV
jgi:hypothetical protein